MSVRTALACGNDLNVIRRLWRKFAIFHLEVLSSKITSSLRPKVFHHLDVFAGVVVAVSEILIAWPEAHLAILR